MKIIHLTALDLDLEVSDTVHYQDDGIVESIEGKTTSLDWHYEKKFSLEETDNTLVGRKNLYYLKGQWYMHAFYLRQESHEYEHMVRWHEEMHVIRTIDLINNSGYNSSSYATQEFQIAALKRKGIGLDITKIENDFPERKFAEEVIAELGGIFAVHQKYDCILKPVKENSIDYHTIAFEIYQQAMQNSLRISKNSRRKSLWQRLFS